MQTENKLYIPIIFFLSLVILLGAESQKAPQSSPKDGNMDFLSEENSDTLLKNLKTIIPENWETTIINRKITIKRKEAVWILFENKINAPMNMETEEEWVDRIKNSGKKTLSQLVYLIQEKWSDDKADDVKDKNSAIEKQIIELPIKHKISHLLNKFSSRKFETFYSATTEEDKTRIENYHYEKKKLKTEFIKYPDFHFGRYSFFLIEKTGATDDFHTVYPRTASVEMMRIEKILRNQDGRQQNVN